MGEGQKKIDEKISKWYNVDIAAYEVIYKEAKENLEEQLSESESITNKSFKILFAFFAYLAFIYTYFKDTPKFIVFIQFLLMALAIFYLIRLIFPKNISQRGTEPEILLVSDFDAETDKGYFLNKTYYSAICTIQSKIDTMKGENTKRIEMYQISIICIVLSILLTLAFVAFC